VKIVNLNKDLLRCGWVINHLPSAVKPVVPGLTASFFLKATFAIAHKSPPTAFPKGPDTLAGDRPMEGDPKLGIVYASDFVPYKPKGDFTLVGCAHNPSDSIGIFTARARIGNLERGINVVGARKWETSMGRLHPSRPEPVGTVMLSYAHAWGGPHSRTNPLGCGQEDDRLPHFEEIDQTITSRAQNATPAGFAPYPRAMPLRQSKLGSYDKEWFQTRWPWMPDDFDWSYFNSAPPSQWKEGYFVGNEDLEFHHLHADHRVYRSALPGLQGRCFVMRGTDTRQDFREVPLDLDTVWVDMANEKLVLVWRGRCPVSSLKLRDVSGLLALLEPLRTSDKSLTDYQALFAKGLERPKPAERAPNPQPDLAAGKADAEAKVAPLMAKRAEYLETLAAMEAATLAAQPKFAANAPGMQAQQIDHPEAMTRLKAIIARTSSAPGITDVHRSAMARAVAELELLGDPKMFAETKRAEAEARMGAKHAKGRMQKASPPRTPDAMTEAREVGFAHMDLEGGDFSHLDLAEIDFRGASLRNTNFEGAILRRANLKGANLSKANLTGADLSAADLAEADFSECSVENTVWKQACLKRTKLRGLQLSGTDFSHAHGPFADFQGANLEGASFQHCNLPRANFVSAKLNRAKFSHAILSDANFRQAEARNSSFHDSDLTNARAGLGADFADANFERISAAGSIWKGSSLVGANFQQANLRRSIFTCAKLDRSVFDRCEMEKATFEEAILLQALLTRANLLLVNFNRADLTDAVLDGSNLYGSSLWDTIILRATWKDANIKKTRLAG